MSFAELTASNDDLLTQILLQLPMKSKGKFKLVSKHWHSLISTTPKLALSKPFRSVLLHHGKNYSHIELLPLPAHHRTPPLYPFEYLPYLGDGSLRCLQSCNGLFLCYRRRKDSKTVYYHIYNPTTKHHVAIPPLPQLGDSKVFGGLAFDPSFSPYYKIVCFLIFRCPPGLCQVVIYSSKTRKWRLSGDSFAPNFHLRMQNPGVFWNGSIYWSKLTGSFRFDVEEEKIIEIPMPPLSDDHDMWVKYLGVSWGHLYLINGADSVHGHLNIYEIEGDGSCWRLKHQAEVGGDLVAVLPAIVWQGRFNRFSVLFFSDEDDQDPFLVIQIRNEVVCYNIKNREFNKIYHLPWHQSTFLYMGSSRIGAYQYIESLSPVS